MLEFSAADGFVEISRSFGDMITYVANEPSLGLYYIQQHSRDKSANLTSLLKEIKESSQQVSLRTDDLTDSVATVASMKEDGLLIAHEMIQDIEKCLATTSRRHGTSSSFGLGMTNAWIPRRWSLRSSVGYGDSNNQMNKYLSVALKSAKQKAQKLKWPQLNSNELKEDISLYSDPWTMDPASGTDGDGETDELPLSTQAGDEAEDGSRHSGKMEKNHVLPHHGSFDELEADREVRLEKWLKDSSHCDVIGAEVNRGQKI